MKLLTPDAGVIKVWTEGLSDLPEPAIRMGLVKARNFTGYFSLPAFRELCQVSPQDFGMPDPRAAYIEACNKQGPKDQVQWSHPAVYWAGVETGWFELHNRTEKEIFPLFKRNYEIVCERAIRGERLDLPTQRAIADSHTPVFLTREQNKRRLASLREML